MIYLGKNLRFLRKQKGWTQAELAEKLQVNRSLIGAYEEGRSEPRLTTLMLLCELFKVDVASLLQKPLAESTHKLVEEAQRGDYLRVLPVVVQEDGRERVPLVPQKAAAGYTKGYADMEYIENLPLASLPFPELQHSGTQRLFQIEGDSMLPIPPGSYILGTYVQNWQDIKDYRPYLVLTAEEGIVFKRVLNELAEKEQLWLMSDNTEYEPYALEAGEIREVWLAQGFFCFELPPPYVDKYEPSDQKLMLDMLKELKREVQKLQKDRRS